MSLNLGRKLETAICLLANRGSGRDNSTECLMMLMESLLPIISEDFVCLFQ